MCGGWNIHAIPEVEVAVVKCPILEGRMGKEWGSVSEVGKSMKYKRVRRQ